MITDEHNVTHLNPEHETSRKLDGNWCKIVALIMYHLDERHIEIDEATIKALGAENLAVAVTGESNHIVIDLVPFAEAEKLAESERIRLSRERNRFGLGKVGER